MALSAMQLVEVLQKELGATRRLVIAAFSLAAAALGVAGTLALVCV